MKPFNHIAIFSSFQVLQFVNLMSKVIHLKTPLTDDDVVNLRIGDRVSISGIIYTARDAAHKRLVELMR